MATLIVAACGSVGDPLPPLVHLPQPVADLRVRQVANQLQVAWSWPQLTTEGMVARRTGNFTLWAVDVPSFDQALTARTIDQYRREVLTLDPALLGESGPGDRIDVRVPLRDWQVGQQTVLVVTAANRAGRYAGYSNQALIQPLMPPERVVWKSHSVQAAGVVLAWLPSRHAEEYAIERSATPDEAYVSLGRLAATTYLDGSIGWDQTYQYRIRPLRSSQAGWVEGTASDTVSVTPRDIFPPTSPTGLRAVRTALTVELSWLASPEPDVAGYRVYRDGLPVSESVPGTTYSDAGPLAAAHEFAVSAVDTSGNESAPGPAITVLVPSTQR